MLQRQHWSLNSYRYTIVSVWFHYSLVLMTHGIHLMFVEFWFCRCWEQFECFVGWAETWSTGNHWATLAMKSPANVYSCEKRPTKAMLHMYGYFLFSITLSVK